MDENNNALVQVDAESGVTIDWQALLKRPLSEMADDEVFAGFTLLDVVAKALGERSSTMKGRVRDLVIASGEEVTESTVELRIGDSVVRVTSPSPSVKVDEAAIRALIRRRQDLDLDAAFDQAWVLSQPKLERLIVSGMLSDEEVESFTVTGPPPTPRVQVKSAALGVTKKQLLGG